MGSKSSSRTQNVETNTSVNENISGLDNASVYSDVYGDINQLDGGAIGEAFNFGGRGLDFAGSALDRVLDYGADLSEETRAGANDAIRAVTQAAQSTALQESAQTQNTIVTVVKYLAYAGIAYGAFQAFKAYRRGK